MNDYRLLMPLIFGMALLYSCHPKTIPSAAEPVDGIVLDSISVAVVADTLEAVDSTLSTWRWLIFARTPCYGHCPVYSLEVFLDGRAVLQGSAHYDHLGFFESRLSAEKLDEIRRKAEAINFFDFASQYPESGERVPNLPRTLVMIHEQGRLKAIEINYQEPKTLKNFIKYLDLLIEEQDWLSIPDPSNTVE